MKTSVLTAVAMISVLLVCAATLRPEHRDIAAFLIMISSPALFLAGFWWLNKKWDDSFAERRRRLGYKDE